MIIIRPSFIFCCRSSDAIVEADVSEDLASTSGNDIAEELMKKLKSDFEQVFRVVREMRETKLT